jgi:WD40 repeat protein
MRGVLTRFRKTKTAQQEKCQEEENGEHEQLLPRIPSSVWVTHVLPYLDRISQNQLCATCKEIHQTYKQTGVEPQWPNGKFRIRRPVRTVAFSPSGRTLAIALNSKTISLWNRRTGLDQTLVGHYGIVSDVTFAANHALASCSRTDGTIRIWTTDDKEDKEQYRLARVLVIRVFSLRYVRFSPDNDMVASWGNDGAIRLNSVHDAHFYGQTQWSSKLNMACYECVSFPKRHRHILAHSFNNETVRLWNWTTRSSTELRDTEPMFDYGDFVTSIAVLDDPSEQKEYLVVGCRVATVKFWDLNNFTCIRTIHLGSGWSSVTHLVFSQDASFMACTSQGSQIRIFRVSDGHCIETLKGHKDRVESLSFSPDGLTLASGGCDRTMRLWSISNCVDRTDI